MDHPVALAQLENRDVGLPSYRETSQTISGADGPGGIGRAHGHHLSQGERAELAYALLLSLEPEGAGPDAAWDSELARRVAEIREGRAEGKPAEQMFAELRARRA